MWQISMRKISYGDFSYNEALNKFEIILPRNISDIRPKVMDDFPTPGRQ